MLSLEIFKTVVASTPLVSIDLIIRNSQEQVLLGLRNNRPTQGYWFVPGGRIQKDERLENAFRRLVSVELGVNAQGKFMKVCEFTGVECCSGKCV